MRNLTLLLAFLAVLITIKQLPQSIPCPQPPPVYNKNIDGTYSRGESRMITLQFCWDKEVEWQEEWTDYPEKGGKFIRRVEQ